ncbi:MAG: tRNA pseudouridine(38-40) synthase TruA [Flavobacteriales bacterium]|jgi:tRNA pseudouridine38-40 synthase|nr:tRNA pseudouridine(38-40) synthase TruA [Flavobacteriales bacterium]
MSNTQRYFIRFAYNGTRYHGSQVQPDQISVQEEMEKCLSLLCKEKISLLFAGRTDAGVHAKEMWAHFDLQNSKVPEKWVYRMNQFLGKDIAVYEIIMARADAHARFDATERSYEYHISTQKNIFSQETSYFLKHKLDIDLMNKACEILKEYEDFEAFSRTHTDVKTFICNIQEAHWKFENSHYIFHITANRFLRNMVRAIVGTMLDIGKGKTSLETFRSIIESKNRSNAGSSAPAKGLFLTKVQYPTTIF